MHTNAKKIFSLALLFTALVTTQRQVSAETTTPSHSVMAEAINKELGGTLNSSEMAAIARAEATQLEQSRSMQPAFIADFKRLNFLVCASGKTAALAKGRVGVCATPSGQIYRLLGYGAGLSGGVQLSVFGMTVITNQAGAPIVGDYGAATSLSQSGLGFLVQNMFSASAWRIPMNAMLRFLFVFGGPEFAVTQGKDSYMIMAGAGLGPMLDLGVEWFRLIESPK